MADVFISYKREERDKVERLATALRGLGLSVWFDASLSAGETFSDEIDREVRAAKAVVVCWSPAAVASDWVKAEAQIGFSRKKLISTQVAGEDQLEPPVPFNSVHMEDFRHWSAAPSQRDAAWLSITRRLGQLCDRDDIAEWGALGSAPTGEQVRDWFALHGRTSPLVLEAEGLLRELEAEESARDALHAAAQERVARLEAEREGLERERREAERRAAAEERARVAEARASQAQSAARAPRRSFLIGGGLLAAGAASFGGIQYAAPRWRHWFPGVRITRAGREEGVAIAPETAFDLVWNISGVLGGAFSPNGELAYFAGRYHTTQIFRVRDGGHVADLGGPPGGSHEFALSSDGSRAVIAINRQLSVWDARNGRNISTVDDAQRFDISDVAISADGSTVLSGSTDNTVILRDADTGAEIRRFTDHDDDVWFAALSPDGAIAASSTQRETRLWNARRGEAIRLEGGGDGFSTAVISPDGGLLAASNGPMTRLWETSSGAFRGAVAGGISSWWRQCFSADGRRLMTVRSGWARVYDTSSRAAIANLELALGQVRFAALSPDGELIATASGGEGNPVQLWSVDGDRAEVLAELRGHRYVVSFLTFDARSRRLLTGADGSDAIGRVWRISRG